MSSVFEEILTSTTGFIIAMVIMGVVIGIGLYGYWLYVNHVTLENELMPIAEVVPYKGGYYLAVVNTGYEPFTVRQVYLKGGSILSVDSKPLTHNQWFFEQTSQLPIAVRVCSAIDPRVCETIPVHGWSTIDPVSILSNSNGSGLIGVVVYDPYNIGWEVAWTYVAPSYFGGLGGEASYGAGWYGGFIEGALGYPGDMVYALSKSSSYTWFINPPYVPIALGFRAWITNNPTNRTCLIVPGFIIKSYNAGSVQTFNVTCEPAVEVIVYYINFFGTLNQYPTYTINYSGGASGVISGPPSEPSPGYQTYNYVIPTNKSITLTVTINGEVPGKLLCSKSLAAFPSELNPPNWGVSSSNSITVNPGWDVIVFMLCKSINGSS